MTNATLPIQRKHLPALDAVRGVAILCVFFYHLLSTTWGRDQLEWGHWFRQSPALGAGFLWFYPLTFGVMGVPLFFVLSGFVIHYSTITSSQPFKAFNFYSRRFWRIYPPYALALLAFCLMREYTVTPLSVITHVLLLQDFSGKTFYLINPSFWSIATEVQFYLVYPLLIFARGRIGMFKVLMAVLAFSVLFRLALCIVRFHDSAIFEDSHHMMWASPMITLVDWTLGVYLAERFAKGKRVFPTTPFLPGAVVLIFGLSTLIRPLSIFSFQISSLLAAIWIERVIWSSRPMSLAQKLLIPLGLCSYSFYLLHQPLLSMLMRWAGRWITRNPYVEIIGIGPVLFLMLYGLSWAAYQIVERTSVEIGRRFSQSRIAPAPSPG